MKNLKILQIALFFAGCFIGGGFVSGQELWQFFGEYGKSGIIGLIFAVVLLAVIGIAIMFVARKLNTFDVTQVIMPIKSNIAKNAIGIIQCLFLYSVYIIMAAGAGSLLADVFGLQKYIGVLIFLLISTVITCLGFEGFMHTVSIVIPILTVLTFVIAVISVFKGGFPDFKGGSSNFSGLKGGWFSSSVLYVTYNIFCCIPMLVTTSLKCKSGKKIAIGTFLGSILLFIIGFAILVSINCVSGANKTDLPMLASSANISYILKIIYAVLLFLGMLSAAVFSMLGAVDYVALKIKKVDNKKPLFIIISSLVAFPCCLFGFSDLIAVLYPISGYISIIAILGVIINIFKIKKLKN